MGNPKKIVMGLASYSLSASPLCELKVVLRKPKTFGIFHPNALCLDNSDIGTLLP